MTVNIAAIKRDIAEGEAFVQDIQGGADKGAYDVVYPWTLDDLRNARRWLRIRKADLRRVEAAQGTHPAGCCQTCGCIVQMTKPRCGCE